MNLSLFLKSDSGKIFATVLMIVLTVFLLHKGYEFGQWLKK